jgi:hypothetical protein
MVIWYIYGDWVYFVVIFIVYFSRFDIISGNPGRIHTVGMYGAVKPSQLLQTLQEDNIQKFPRMYLVKDSKKFKLPKLQIMKKLP